MSDEHSSTSTRESFSSFVAENFALCAVLVLTALLALTVASTWLRGFCFARFGLNCCPGSSRRRQIRNDQILAAQHQRELAQQIRERAKPTQSKSKDFYQHFLNVNNTRVVQPQDLLIQKTEHSPQNEAVIGANDDAIASCQFAQKGDHDCSPNKGSEFMSENDCSESTHSDDWILQFTVQKKSNDDDDDDIPAAGKMELRRAEATCCICVKRYQPGEIIVWSGAELASACRHVFHADCMLEWVSTTGKRRCPVCRDYFFPSRRAVAAAGFLTMTTSHNNSNSTDASTSQASSEEHPPITLHTTTLAYGDTSP